MKPNILSYMALAAILSIIINNNCFALESESNREEIVTKRSKRFYNKNRTRQYLAFGGVYSSDYNSKDFDFTTRYLFQNSRLINEINFINENQYADRGGGQNKEYRVKKSERYDLVLSSKFKLKKDSKYYATAFHRTIYDDMSIYYYDLHSAAGLGKSFLNEKCEFDISIGYHETKNTGHKINFIPSIRTNFKLSKNLKLIQRGYWFLDHESVDNGLKTRLVYRLNKKLSIELRHNFEQRRYEDDENNEVRNLVNRSLTFGLIFDL